MNTPTRRLLAAPKVFEVQDAEVDGHRILTRRSSLVPRNRHPTIVVLGGTALSGRYLLPVAVELAHRFPVWAPDLPGRGASDAPKKQLSVEEVADFLVKWMNEVGLQRVALLGNSMGCQVAVEVAARHAPRVSHVILQAPTTDARARTLPRQLARLVLDGTREPSLLGPIEFVDWLRAGPRSTWASVRATLEHRIEDRLSLVSCPALVVRGTRDPVVPHAWAVEVTDRLPDGRLREVPGAAHAMVFTHPLELARVTAAFLR